MGLRNLLKGNLQSITVGPNYQGKIVAGDVHPALREQSVQLGLALQTTLDVYELIRTFNKKIQPLVGQSYIEYQNAQSNHGLAIGNPQPHEVVYDLELEDIKLGCLKLGKKEPFTKQSLFQLENAIAHLVYPLRNALNYHEAVVHALTCPLTQLGNKKAYNKMINREVEFATRHKTPLSILVIDIDNFKMINDTYGHQAGDVVLAELGKIMLTINRTSDAVFRYGGEEFVVVLGNTNKDGAHEVAKRLQNIVKATEFTFESKQLPTTLSIGLAEFEEGDTPDRLFQRADQALYQAKNTGKNKIVIWQ